MAQGSRWGGPSGSSLQGPEGQGTLTAVGSEESPDLPSHSPCQVLGKAPLVFEGLKSRSSPNVPWVAGATLK